MDRHGAAPGARQLTGLLLVRTAWLLGPAGSRLTARTIGLIEAGLGVLFVVLSALTWARP